MFRQEGGKLGRDSNPSRFNLSGLTHPSIHFPSTWIQTSTWLIQTKPNKLLQQDLEGICRGSWHILELSAEFRLVKKVDASCNPRLLLTSISGLHLAWKRGIPKSKGSVATHCYRDNPHSPHHSPGQMFSI